MSLLVTTIATVCSKQTSLLFPSCLHGEAGTAAGQGGLPERQGSARRVQTAATSSPAEVDH